MERTCVKITLYVCNKMYICDIIAIKNTFIEARRIVLVSIQVYNLALPPSLEHLRLN